MPKGVHLPKIEKNCAACGKLMLVNGSRARKQKFCSRACSGMLKIETLLICKHCGKGFRQTSHKREQSFCSKLCWGRHMGDERIRASIKSGVFSNYRDAKEYLLAVSPCCHCCGWNTCIEILELHHKDRNRSNNHLENLELICPNCHTMEHFEARDGQFGNNLGVVNGKEKFKS